MNAPSDTLLEVRTSTWGTIKKFGSHHVIYLNVSSQQTKVALEVENLYLVTLRGCVWPSNEHENIHIDNNKMFMSSDNYKESGCSINLTLLPKAY